MLNNVDAPSHIILSGHNEGSSRILYAIAFLVIIVMAAWMIPSAAAGGAFPVKSKQEAEAKCKEIGTKYDNYAIYRDGPQGNDILYACDYQSETKTKLNRPKQM